MCQGGDPTGTGRGGPGYRFDDELPKAGQYQIGSVAMANAGPNTNGSQFFLISGNDGVRLPPQYSLFGQIVKGLDVLEQMQRVKHRRRRPSRRGRRHQLGHDHRVRTDRWACSTGARRSSPAPAGASARPSPRPSTPPAPASPSSPARPTSSQATAAGLANDPVVVPADLGTPDGPAPPWPPPLDAFGGRVDVLVNNAGIGLRKDSETLTVDELDLVWNVNVRSALLATTAVLPAMLAAGSGSIISISSISGLRGAPRRAVYAASKAALDGMTRALAMEYGPRGIRANCRRARRRRDRDVARPTWPSPASPTPCSASSRPAACRRPRRSPTPSCSSPPTPRGRSPARCISADGGIHSTVNLWPTV